MKCSTRCFSTSLGSVQGTRGLKPSASADGFSLHRPDRRPVLGHLFLDDHLEAMLLIEGKIPFPRVLQVAAHAVGVGARQGVFDEAPAESLALARRIDADDR